MYDRSIELRKASWIGIIGNSLLAFLKVIIGLLSGSFAVIADGIDTLSDVLTFFITLFTARIISKPADCKYPYGYKKAETVATKILAFIIFFAGAQLLISTLSRLSNGEMREMPSIIAVYVTLFSIVGKILLFIWQKRIGKRTNSAMILANARNMLGDVLISSSVLAGLIFTFALQLPVLDTITGMAVSLWIIWVAFGIYRETSFELMDKVTDVSIYYNIIKSVEQVKGAYNPHRIRVRKIADLFLIALDIEVDQNILVSKAHEIAKEVEQTLKQNINNIYDILIHVEPLGNDEAELFGISKDNLSLTKTKAG